MKPWHFDPEALARILITINISRGKQTVIRNFGSETLQSGF